MDITYVAKHASGDNDDEGAVAHALRQLGHSVRCVHEHQGHLVVQSVPDLLLFHKWYDCRALAACRAAAKAFWHFDLVDSDDWELRARNVERVRWINSITPLVTLGFCTDGDWVAKDTTGKLRWLAQGMDERAAGPTEQREQDIDLLFTGTTIHGGRRMSHIQELKARYGNRLTVIGDRERNRVHGRALAGLYARAKICIAPDGPTTDNYWSNRVYNTLGLGGFLLHPNCARLREHYEPHELLRYDSRGHLNELIDSYLDEPALRREIMLAGYRATVERNLYRHRCQVLIQEVEAVRARVP